MKPDFGDNPTRALLAVLTQKRPTLRTVLAATDATSLHTTHTHLTLLRDAGLVIWAPGKTGTLRATCVLIPIERQNPDGD